MKNKLPAELSQLHCGACSRNFDNINELKEHISSCPVARCLLPMIYLVMNGKDKMGHPLSRFIQNSVKHQNSITEYAYSIADELDTFTRSKKHASMCEKLDLDYNKFRPFENSSITTLFSRKDALDYLWDELCKHVISTMCQAGY